MAISSKRAAHNATIDLLRTIDRFLDSPSKFINDSYRKQLLRATRFNSHSLAVRVSKLKKSGLIQEVRKGRKVYYDLTVTGKQKLAIRSIFENKFRQKGFSCIIIFDIPEKYRKHRRYLRNLLLKNGFINLQKSVLIGPEFLPREFLDLLKQINIRKFVTVIRGNILYQ